MRFGEVPVAEAVGGLLAHTLRGEGFTFKKGRWLTAEDVARLAAAGVVNVTVARLEADDVAEDAAAAALGRALAGEGVTAQAAFTGRCNLYADAAGIARIDAERIAAINAVDEAVTVATLAPFARVEPRQMVATVKIIPFAAPRAALERALALAAAAGGPAIAVAPFRARRTLLVQTTLPGQKPSLLAATRQVMAGRLADLGSPITGEEVVPHDACALSPVLTAATAARPTAELILIVGASAIVDRRDVIPAAITAAGGRIERFGMPVEPGNLALLARLGGATVLGLPGCARTPKLNGVDWLLERLCAGLDVDAAAIAAMGVGGLLVDSGERRPRVKAAREGPRAPRAAAIVLAAGRGSRFGAAPKLASPYGGEPLLRRAVDAALDAGAAPVIVVLGHRADQLRGLIADLPVRVVENAHYGEGLATSLATGLGAVPADADAAFVLLADMPRVRAAHLGRLLAAFDPAEGRAICVPTFAGRRGNPVLWGRALFVELGQLSGDEGGRVLIARHPDLVCEVAMDDDGILFDIDEPAALMAHGG